MSCCGGCGGDKSEPTKDQEKEKDKEKDKK